MSTRVAINGLGRIGRAALEIAHETPELDLVAVKDIAQPDNLAYLLKHDPAYGPYHQEVGHEGETLHVGEKSYRVLGEKNPA